MKSPEAKRSANVLVTCRLEKVLAQNELLAGRRENAWNGLFGILTRIPAAGESPGSDALLVATSLELSELGFVMGKGFGELPTILQNALAATHRLGDRRSGALIQLHLARLFYFGERRHEAMVLFEQGKNEVEDLGDADILIRSAEFIGLYFFVQGLFAEAVTYFEQAVKSFEEIESSVAINPSAPIWLGYCTAYMGQFHRSIGTLDYYRRMALEKKDRSLATTIRAVLGIVLLLADKKSEAAYHLSGALQQAIQTGNALALYFARGGLAYHHTLEGRISNARELLGQAVLEGASAGLIRQYASPMVLEMLYEIDRSGLPSLPQMSFQGEVVRVLQEPNVHLRGVALRLRAMDRASKNDSFQEIMADLKASEDYLVCSGTAVQLAKTTLEMVRLYLRHGDEKTARPLAQNAWMALSGYGDGFYPDDLRHLLEVRNDSAGNGHDGQEFMDRFTEIIEELIPTADLTVLLNRTVTATNRYLGAERGGIFWFSRKMRSSEPVLRAACNLSQNEVASEAFRPNLELVRKAYRENTPKIATPRARKRWQDGQKSILCVPFEVEGAPRGVLYHDNSYLDGCFDFLDMNQLVQIARYLSVYVAQVHSHCLRLEAAASRPGAYGEVAVTLQIFTRSPHMQTILEQADLVAATESTVLILGETGVGKELLAHRIHRMSSHRDHPLVIIDPTTIPENLFESELFGHEKGAFTGADRQKKGRMELAHRGTLFIDEVGEIPLPLQVKLLRVLQEKTLVRVGGAQTISSNFRLLVATNRDLAAAVAAGRFREDLFYRLNVIPFILPPLRERVEDVTLLARHFLNRYSAKYNRLGLTLTSEDEKKLKMYDWPGNVRELKNVIERAVILSTGERVSLDISPGKKSIPENPFDDFPSLDQMQGRYIEFVLAKTGGRIGGAGGAAEILGMKRSSLYSRMEKLGIR